MQSNPDIVISMIGAKESINERSFTPDSFTQAYTSFIKELQALPSKPNFLLITPIYSAEYMVKMNKMNVSYTPFKLNELDGKFFMI